MDKGAAEPKLLTHAARKLLGWTILERSKPRTLQQLGNALFPLDTGLTEQLTEENDVLFDAEIRIEIFAKSLRQIGDAHTNRSALPGVCHVSVEDHNLPGLNAAGARNDCQQGGLADAVGPDESYHAATWDFDRDTIEREPHAVSMGQIFDRRPTEHAQSFVERALQSRRPR